MREEWEPLTPGLKDICVCRASTRYPQQQQHFHTSTWKHGVYDSIESVPSYESFMNEEIIRACRIGFAGRARVEISQNKNFTDSETFTLERFSMIKKGLSDVVPIRLLGRWEILFPWRRRQSPLQSIIVVPGCKTRFTTHEGRLFLNLILSYVCDVEVFKEQSFQRIRSDSTTWGSLIIETS